MLRRCLAAAMAVFVVGAACAAEPAAPYHVGGTCRVFHPQVERHWRGARTEALVTNIWYPVDASVPETTRNIGEPGRPTFRGHPSAGEAALAPGAQPTASTGWLLHWPPTAISSRV